MKNLIFLLLSTIPAYSQVSKIIFKGCDDSSNEIRDEIRPVGVCVIDPVEGSTPDTLTKTFFEKFGLEYRIPWSLEWSPDGLEIAVKIAPVNSIWADWRRSDDWIWILKFDGTEARPIMPPDDGGISRPSWSPDGQSLVYVDRKKIKFLKLDGTPDGEIYGHYTTFVDWTPDGRILFTKFDSQIWIAEKHDNNWESRYTGIPGRHAIMSPDLSMLAIWDWDLEKSNGGSKSGSSISIVDIPSQEKILYLGGCKYPSWSPDSKQIVYMGGDNYGRDINIINVDGTNHFVLYTPENYVKDISWSPWLNDAPETGTAIKPISWGMLKRTGQIK